MQLVRSFRGTPLLQLRTRTRRGPRNIIGGALSTQTSQNRRFSSADEPARDRPGIHKTPVVDHLWSIREEIKRKRRDDPAYLNTKIRKNPGSSEHTTATPSGKSETLNRLPSDSHTSVVYAFGSDEALRAMYVNPWGRMRIGKIVEDLDALAGTIAFKHMASTRCESGSDPLIVTASIDRIKLAHSVHLKHDVVLSGQVVWTGTSSMEIAMQAVSSNPKYSNAPFLSSRFVFVARNREDPRYSVPVPRLVPETGQEKQWFDVAEARNNAKRLKRKQLQQQQSHSLSVSANTMSQTDASPSGDDEPTALEIAHSLWSESQALLDMPTLCQGRRQGVLMESTVLENAVVMQRQQENTAGRVFGGYLLRKAFELAFAATYLFAGHVPRFMEVDEVLFTHPVDVGDLVRFKSMVLYTTDSTASTDQSSTIHVQVSAHIINVEEMKSVQANKFNFTFKVSPSQANSAPTSLMRVLPNTFDQALAVGTRMVQDIEQSKADQLTDATDIQKHNE